MSSHMFSSIPPPAHNVWILDCKNCSIFLTNRAMKAVLLLRPNVSLYSSDTLPVNCSPYNSNSDPSFSLTAYKSSTTRTCECLTQYLCCHGCGSTIGYMIIVPCSRCTSLSEPNRATNGHRFVFQSTEVLSTVRHYVQNEKGIIPFDTTQHLNLDHTDNPADPSIDPLSAAPALEFTNILDYSHQQHFEHDPRAYPSLRVYPSTFQPHPTRFPGEHPYAISSADAQSYPPLVSPNHSYIADHKYAPTAPPILKAGDVLFWHHLAWSGEIIEAVNDERARRPAQSTSGGMDFDR